MFGWQRRPLCSYRIALRCARRSGVRGSSASLRTLTGGKAARPEADYSNLISRISTIGIIPSLPVCVHGAFRGKCTFVKG